jgi:hypothetical protein
MRLLLDNNLSPRRPDIDRGQELSPVSGRERAREAQAMMSIILVELSGFGREASGSLTGGVSTLTVVPR